MSTIPTDLKLSDLTNYLPGTLEWIVAEGHWKRSIGHRPDEWGEWETREQAYHHACATLETRDADIFLAGHIMVMAKIANHHGRPANYVSDGITITVRPGDNPTAVLDAFKAKKAQRIVAFWQSDRGRHLFESLEDLENSAAAAKLQPIKSFTQSNPAFWETVLVANSDPAQPDFLRALRWGARWANLLEAGMGVGARLEDIADPMSRVADVEGYPEAYLPWVIMVLEEVWVHGHELSAWYNNQVQDGHQIRPLFLPVG